MTTFEEFQRITTAVPFSLRNNLDRINFPVLGLQESAGRVGSLLSSATASGRFSLTAEQRNQLRDRLADTLWCVALLCGEAGISMNDLAEHSLVQLQERARNLDPDER